MAILIIESQGCGFPCYTTSFRIREAYDLGDNNVCTVYKNLFSTKILLEHERKSN